VDHFGTTGEPPTHPGLLDHLSVRFMASGWSLKQLIREIVLSQTYRLAGGPSNSAAQYDPENRLLSRMNLRRLDAECIRDAILAVSGRLDLRAGGSTIPDGLKADYGFEYRGFRRSVYVPVLRNALPEMFEVFDFADPSMVVGTRHVSTVAPQALFLLNHPFVMEEARHAAERLLHTSDPDPVARVRRLYLLTVGRPPTDAEFELATRFLAGAEGEPAEALAQLVQALFASLDFRHVW
jgi:hypothetical protein